jgi:hypothetical protein
VPAPEIFVFSESPGNWQGCWLALFLPIYQHSCASCLNIAWPIWKDILVAKVAITASSKGCNHSVERASLRLVSTPTKCGTCQPEVGVHSKSPGPLAGASGPVSVLDCFNLHVWHQKFDQYRTNELRRIKLRTFHCSPLINNIPCNRMLQGQAADFFPETEHLLI